MLDEPSLGLAPVMVGELFSALARIRHAGVSLLIVEQNVRKSRSLADRGYVIEARAMPPLLRMIPLSSTPSSE
ncbi:hypothetical protein [Chelativorans salis]|uniref:hypothetical protein n=1 Tax=Chelativorans salis TaxID=2978478 RepID=UPI003CC5F6A7